MATANYNNVRGNSLKRKDKLIKGVKPMDRKKFIKSKKILLNDFGINLTDEIVSNIESLYPNELAVERYTRNLILKKLGN